VSASASRKKTGSACTARGCFVWIGVWGAGIVFTGHTVLGQPVGYLLLAVALVFVFALVNGISVGVSDSNPISSAVRRGRGADGGNRPGRTRAWA
jgi:hypothetical protein